MTSRRRGPHWRGLFFLSILWLFLLGAFGATINAVFSMLNKPSDLAFYAGAFLAAGVLVGLFEGARLLMKLTKLALLAALVVTSSACVGRVEPGHAGIQVNSWGTNRGVQDYTITTGGYTYNPFTTSVFEYPTYVQSAVWTRDKAEGHPTNEEVTFTTNDQMAVAIDINIAYHLVQEKVPAFYVAFRSDDLNAFTHGWLRNQARDCINETAGKYKIEQIMGDNAPFIREVREDLQKKLDPIGVVLDQFGIIGAPRPPQPVIDAINAKNKAVQQAIQVENELRQSEAEAKKKVAQSEGEARSKIALAEGEAKANQVLQQSITPTLIQWRQLEIQTRATEKWDGKLPQYTLGGGIPLINIPQK